MARAGTDDSPFFRNKRSLASIAAALLLVAATARAGDTAPPSADRVAPLTVGASVPSVLVNSVEGEAVALDELVRDGALLVFYRGGW